MKNRVTALLLATLLFTAPTFAWVPQAEHLKTTPSVSVVLDASHRIPGAAAGLDDHARLVKNDVSYVWRHCQKYAVAGKLSELGQKACASDPTTVFSKQVVHNLRTTAGGDWQASVMGNTAAPPATCNYIALSNDATAPNVADTAVASEIVANGLSRAQGTYAHTNGTASFTVQKVFNATGTQASQKAGLLNASSSGTLCFENTYTQVTVNNGDTLTV